MNSKVCHQPTCDKHEDNMSDNLEWSKFLRPSMWIMWNIAYHSSVNIFEALKSWLRKKVWHKFIRFNLVSPIKSLSEGSSLLQRKVLSVISNTKWLVPIMYDCKLCMQLKIPRSSYIITNNISSMFWSKYFHCLRVTTALYIYMRHTISCQYGCRRLSP